MSHHPTWTEKPPSLASGGKRGERGGGFIKLTSSVVGVVVGVPVLSIGGQSDDIVEGEGFGEMVGGGVGVNEDGVGELVDHDGELIVHGILVVVESIKTRETQRHKKVS